MCTCCPVGICAFPILTFWDRNQLPTVLTFLYWVHSPFLLTFGVDTLLCALVTLLIRQLAMRSPTSVIAQVRNYQSHTSTHLYCIALQPKPISSLSICLFSICAFGICSQTSLVHSGHTYLHIASLRSVACRRKLASVCVFRILFVYVPHTYSRLPFRIARLPQHTFLCLYLLRFRFPFAHLSVCLTFGFVSAFVFGFCGGYGHIFTIFLTMQDVTFVEQLSRSRVTPQVVRLLPVGCVAETQINE